MKSSAKNPIRSAHKKVRWTVVTIIKCIQNNLTPDLLKTQFRDGNAANPLFGHCYHSAEALYHLIRALQVPKKYFEFRPCRGVDVNNVPHWWLQNECGDILDPTVEQYTSKGLTPPYSTGRFRPFLTKQPSKNANIIIRCINSSK